MISSGNNSRYLPSSIRNFPEKNDQNLFLVCSLLQNQASGSSNFQFNERRYLSRKCYKKEKLFLKGLNIFPSVFFQLCVLLFTEHCYFSLQLPSPGRICLTSFYVNFKLKFYTPVILQYEYSFSSVKLHSTFCNTQFIPEERCCQLQHE